MTRPQTILMLGPSLDSRGGIASVAAMYRDRGFFAPWGIDYVATSHDGSGPRKWCLLLAALLSVIHALIRGRVAALHIHTASRRSFWRKSLFAYLGFTFRRPVILHIHGGAFLQFLDEECTPLQRRLALSVLSRSAALVVLSETFRRDLLPFVGGRRIEILRNPISHTHSARATRADADGATLLFLGRIEPAKGISDLLAACAALMSTGCPITLLCAGTGLQHQAQREAQRLGIEPYVRWLGWVDGKGKQALLNNSTLFVLPSYHEGLPMALLEAMAAGVPVIATRVGGIPDVVTHQVHGLLVPPGDISALTDAIRTLVMNPDVAARMGQAAQASVAHGYRFEHVSARLEALYRSLGLHRGQQGKSAA